MKPSIIPIKLSSSMLIIGLGVFLAITPATAQNVTATSVADAIDSLKTASLNKMDWEVEATAQAFTDAKNINNSLFWSDWARPFLDITLEVFSGLTTIPNLETGGVRQYLHDGFVLANNGKSYYSLFTSLDRFRQDGANLELAIDGPSYNGVVSAMLDRADASSFFFDYTLYMTSIENDLNGTIPANCPIRISHKSTEYDRSGGNIFNGKLEARAYVETQFATLSTMLRQAQLPQQRINELVAFVQARRQEILQSGSAPGMGSSHVSYDAFLTKNGTVTKRTVNYNLGTISQLRQWRLSVLDLFIQSLGTDMIELTSRVVEKGGDFVTDKALEDFTKTVNLNLNVEAVVSGQVGANFVVKDATSLGLSVATAELGTLAGQEQSYTSSSREQIDMIPQQMMDSLPGEISKVLLLTDDTVKYAQLTIASPVVSQVAPGTLPTGTNAQHVVFTGSNFNPPSNPNASMLFFTDPAGDTYLRTPTYVNSGELDYDVTVLSAVGNWTVVVRNGAVESLPARFTVAPAAGQLTALSIAVPASMAENSSVQLTATATIGGVPQTVSGVWHEDSAATDISAGGVLTAGEVAGDTLVNVSCDYTFSGVAKSASASVTVLNASGSGATVNQELVVNGGAESGDTSGWQTSGPIVGINPSFARSGYKYYVFGEVNSSMDTMLQTITIPANASSTTFSVWVWIYSDDPSITAVDTFTAYLLDANNNLKAVMGQFSNLDKSAIGGPPGYKQISFDLSSYRGQTVSLYFVSSLNNSGFSSFKVDDISVVATLTQSTCTFSLSSSGDIWAAAGGSDGFNVIAPAGCPWTVTENLDWVRITSGASGSGTHGVFYTVDYNPTTTPRSGVINAAGQSFTVNQNGNGTACVFRLSSPGYAWPAAGGSDAFTILTDAICWWEIKSNDRWISVSTNEMTGSASISYTVQSNTASGSRTGTITAAGQTFTITQAGTPPPPGSLSSGLNYPTSIAVDDIWVYYTATVSGKGVLNKVLKTGGGETTVLGTNFGYYGHVAVNDTDIFCSLFGNILLKVPKNGGAVTTLFSTNQGTIESIILRDGLVYWADYYGGTISSVSVNGGAVSTVATSKTSVGAIVVDETNMYWTTMDYPGSVYWEPKNGGSWTALAAFMSPTLGLLMQSNWLYWTASSYIYRIPKTGGNKETLASGLNSAWDMESDGTNLYWVEDASPGGCVKQMPINGGPIITLATNLPSPSAIAIDAQNVYVAVGDNRVLGSIMRVAKAVVQVDTIAPQIYVGAPLTGARVNDPTLLMAGTAVDDVLVSAVEFQVNGGTWNAATGTTNWTAAATLQGGTNGIVVRARDSSGNISTEADLAVVYLVPDVTSPTVTITTPTTNVIFVTSDPSVSLGGQATDNVAVTSVLLDNDRGGNAAAALAGSTWTASPMALQVGQNTVTVTASDAAGNSQQAQIIIDRLSPMHNTLVFEQSPQPGQFQFRFYGQPQVEYEIQTSTNMVQWISIGTNSVPITGFFEFTSPLSGDALNTFFRVKLLSP